MGFSFWGFVLVLSLCFRPLVCQQQPNTDGSFVSDFFNKMGLDNNSSKFKNLFSAHFCSWPGVFCDSQQQNVIKLVASGLSLSGAIPENTIGKLAALETLDLSYNNITALSSDFWSLGFLKSLNLSFNQISGELPSNIGNFGQLEMVDLSWNRISGGVPEAISSLVSLQVLKFDHNEFELGVPLGILQCKSLVSVDLSVNNLNGTLHEDFGAALPELKFLNLAGNGISGRGSEFSGMVAISHLNLSGNAFNGPVLQLPEAPLEVVDLSRNQFQGHISQVNFDFNRLVYLDLSENELSGEFFDDLDEAKNLRHLSLAHNRFSRQELRNVNLSRLPSIEHLNLSDCNLIGNMSSELTSLSSLRALDLSNNHLVGHIPVLNTETLEQIDVSHNNLSGEIPRKLMQKLPFMQRFNFSYNNLTLCSSDFSRETLNSAFIGSTSTCPIAADPKMMKRRAEKHGRGLKLAVALTISMVCLLVGLLFLAFGCRKKTRMWEVKQNSYKEEQAISGPFSFQTDSTTWVADVKQATAVPVVIFEKPLLNFTFADLLSATSHFDRGTLLAEGRFGPVYRGFLPGGIHVAVKVLVHGSTMTDQEAARELEYLGRIKHPNLVPLTGYCLAGEQRIAIYDYMENGNLQNLLHDLPLGVQATEDWRNDTWEEDDSNAIQNVGSEGLLTTWRFRHKILLGTSRALAFLHHGCSPPIIHRDVKASSVYLDQNLEPRLSDFGLAKIFGNTVEDEIARGSPGYIPPEFLEPQIDSPKSPTPKSDVYGFGVILFELVTGKKPVEDDYPEENDGSLVGWVRGLVRRGAGSRAIDPKLHESGVEMQMVEALKIGYLCTADHPSKRPSMQQVVGLLKDIEPSS